MGKCSYLQFLIVYYIANIHNTETIRNLSISPVQVKLEHGMTNIRGLLSFNIKKRRQILGISQVNLAEKVGTSTQYIGQIEQNKKFPSPEMLERIAEALEVDSPQLFSMEAYSQTAIQQFKENLKSNLEKAIDDFIDKGLNEVEILGVNVFFGGKKE
jgi:transcriptional regulator with XRE-family HTH domain